MKTTREISADLLYEILEEGAYANLLLNKSLLGIAEKRDRAFVTNMVYGTIHRLTPIDYQIRRFLQKPIKKKDIYLQTLLRAAFFEILFTAAKPHAVVNEYVNLGKKKGNIGWSKMINGILRNLLRNKDQLCYPEFENEAERAAFFGSIPDWLYDLWKKEHGTEITEKIIESMDAERFPVLRVNTLKISRSELQDALSQRGIDTELGVLSGDALRTSKGADLKILSEDLKGLFTVQEESSQLVAKVLDPKKGSKVLDICAAPGGKTTHIAQLMENDGEIFASDLYDHKIKLINENAENLGITMINAMVKDGTEWGTDYPEYFDYILLDAPCSGFGVLHRRSDSRLRKQKEDTYTLAALQRDLLASAYKALKPGGTMVYSTCTISNAENIDNVEWFLDQYSDMKAVPFDRLIASLTENEVLQAQKGFLEILPHVHHTDGFFISKFVKEKK